VDISLQIIIHDRLIIGSQTLIITPEEEPDIVSRLEDGHLLSLKISRHGLHRLTLMPVHLIILVLLKIDDSLRRKWLNIEQLENVLIAERKDIPLEIVLIGISFKEAPISHQEYLVTVLPCLPMVNKVYTVNSEAMSHA
jgi:hypothetical protein